MVYGLGRRLPTIEALVEGFRPLGAWAQTLLRDEGSN